MVDKNNETMKKVSMPMAVISMVLIIAALIAGIKLSFGSQMSVLAGAVVAVAIVMALGYQWKDIQKKFVENVQGCIGCLMILILVGLLVGVWIIGGTLPTLIYYGLKIIAPSALVPLTFLLCATTSVFTGTSYGSIATMGLAMYGIGANMGISPALIAGAVVSGSYFGDKMSPMSDTTNLAPAMAGTDLYSHIGSMFYSTIPATLVTLVLYMILGHTGSENADVSSVQLIQDTLSAHFHIHLVCMIPLVLILVLSAVRVPAILAMGSTIVVSIILAVVTQGANVSNVMSSAMNGYVSDTGVAMVDTILSRGGAKSMIGTISIIFFASLMAAALQAAGIIEVLMDHVLKRVIHSRKSLIISTLVYAYVMLLMTGNQVMGIIIPGKTMAGLYDDLNVNRKVLSRTLEDSATIGSVLVPWGTGAAYALGVLGCSLSYIPFAFLCYIVPVFSIILAFTGIGIWDSEGKPVWKKTKGDCVQCESQY